MFNKNYDNTYKFKFKRANSTPNTVINKFGNIKSKLAGKANFTPLSSSRLTKTRTDASISNRECWKYYISLQWSLGYKKSYLVKKLSKLNYFKRIENCWKKGGPIKWRKKLGKKYVLTKNILYSRLINNKFYVYPSHVFYNRNNDIVNIEFYHLWFYKTTLRNIFNKNKVFSKTAEGWGTALWKTFRRAPYDRDARRIRDMLKLNWTNSLYLKNIGTLGPNRYKPLKNLKIKAFKRLKKAKYYFKLSGEVFKNGLRLRMLFGKNYTKKKYAPQRKHWKFSKKLARLYFLTAKKHLLQYKLLKNKYLKHVTQYNFINQPLRLLSYFKLLSSFNNKIFASDSSIPRWVDYFNITKRRAKNKFFLLKKRLWSAEHNINNIKSTHAVINLHQIPIKNIKNRIVDIFDYTEEDFLIKEYKTGIIYKKFKNDVIQTYFKSRLNNKFFVNTSSAKRHVRALTKKLKKLKIRFRKTYPHEIAKFLSFLLSKQSNLSSIQGLTLLSLFKYNQNNFTFLPTPTVLYSAPLHLRVFKKSNYFGLIISITQRNYFFTLVKAFTGEVKKVFSSGYSRAKTTRLRRSPIMFTKVFNLLLEYLKNKNINKLKFVRVVQPSLVPKNISFEDQKKINWYPNQFKHARIRVRRWIYELKRVHGLPLRGPKLRRK